MSCKARNRELLPESFCIEGIKTKDPDIISNGFCTYFTNVGKKCADAIGCGKKSFKEYLPLNHNDSSRYLYPNDPSEITKILISLHPKRSTGHDGLSTKMLRDLLQQYLCLYQPL